MDVAEEILQQFARQQVSGSFIEGVISDIHRSQGYAFILKHRDGQGRYLESIDAKVIGKRPSEALQKGIKIRNELPVLFK